MGTNFLSNVSLRFLLKISIAAGKLGIYFLYFGSCDEFLWPIDQKKSPSSFSPLFPDTSITLYDLFYPLKYLLFQQSPGTLGRRTQETQFTLIF